MNRRDLLKGGLAASVLGATNLSAQSSPANHYFELRTYQLRNDLQPRRIQDFFQHHFLPALKRAAAGPVGVFNVMSGMYSPSLVVLLDYKSLADMQAVHERLGADKELGKAWQTFETAELPYARYESTLLKAFDSMPTIEVPPTDAKRPARLFELRTYESKNVFALKAKIDMFNQEEIKLFRKSGFTPVFFGEGVVGTRLPSLTYLIGYDDMAARDKVWQTFVNDPKWNEVKVKPGWTDPEAVSNIYASFLRPTSYSQIR